MEDLLRPIYQERAGNPGTLGILLIEKKHEFSASTDNFDVILFVIAEELEMPWYVKHYEFQDKKAALHLVEEHQVKEWILEGSHRRAVDWVLNGQVLFERNEYIAKERERLREFPPADRKYRMGVEFAKLIRRFTEGKELYESQHYLDAYNNIVHALHHLARLSVIENGFHPEVTVWNQVKRIEPEIYKLYQELVESDESLQKKIELLLLASEYSINSRTRTGAAHMLDVISSQEGLWSFGDLMNKAELKSYSVDLGAMLEHLIDKGLVEDVEVETKGKGIFHRKYKAKEI
ncbi:nucleotidyltransferase-like protein [Bacillus marinisedimentorum]|uniref:nucleotidyltransferase-like protein n=1 Tax=Bacillus marinisedimentorum TaxID=1821260 RepID=UPI0007DFBEDC|nr:nucleotidyltransferase-like protein [Bacillus marinisedimentorum]